METSLSVSNAVFPGEIAGVRLPDSALSVKALQLAREVSEPVVFNHVLRTYVFGRILAQRHGFRLDEELFFLAAVLHDLGLSERFAGSERFEVVGADAALQFLEREGVAEQRRAIVWDAIALHTQVGIVTRKRPEIALVHLGAGMDVLGLGLDALTAAMLSEILEALPRLDFKRAFLDVLLRTFDKSRAALPHTWMMEIARERLDGFHCPTFCESMQAAALPE